MGAGREAGLAVVAGGVIQWGGVLPASARGTPTAVRTGRHRVLCGVRRMDTDRGLRRVPRPGKKRCELDPRGRERMAAGWIPMKIWWSVAAAEGGDDLVFRVWPDI